MPHQRRLDLAGLDAEAAQLYLLIRAPEEVQRAVGAPARQVAGAVHAAARRPEWIRHEPLRRQRVPVQIAARQTGARDVELAGDSGRHRLQCVVQHIDLDVPDRPPDRRRRRPLRRVLRKVVLGRGVRFGGAVVIVQSSIRAGTQEPLQIVVHRERFAALRDVEQRCGVVAALGDCLAQAVDDQIGREQFVDVVGRQPVQELHGIAPHVVGGNKQRLARGERREDFLDRYVKRNGGELSHARTRPAAHGALTPGHQIGDRLVRHVNAFWLSGRARGVGEIDGIAREQVVRRGRRRVLANGSPLGVEPDHAHGDRAADRATPHW